MRVRAAQVRAVFGVSLACLAFLLVVMVVLMPSKSTMRDGNVGNDVAQGDDDEPNRQRHFAGRRRGIPRDEDAHHRQQNYLGPMVQRLHQRFEDVGGIAGDEATEVPPQRKTVP